MLKNEMFCYKTHRSRSEKYELVLGVCDKELVGKVLREDPVFRVDEKFYGKKECGEEKILILMKNCTIGNIVGEKIVKLALKKKFITQKNVILIGDVPHAQFVK